MASAIEYGLIAALITVAVAAGVQSCIPKPPPAAAIERVPPPILMRKNNPREEFHSEVLIDREYKCEYIATYGGLIRRDRADGTRACPDVPPLHAQLQKTKE